MAFYDSHMHTPLCKHAVGEPTEYAAVAEQRGLTGVIFTCHNPLPDGISANVRMAPDEFEPYLAMVQEAREKWVGRLDVRLGLECDVLPGFGLEKWLEEQAAAADFDYLLASIHPHIKAYKERFWTDDAKAYQRLYFDHLAEAAELGLHDALAHPDLVKNVTADDWDFSSIVDHVRRCLDRIAKAGMAMEINTSGWNKQVSEQNPNLAMLKEMAARDIAVVPGSDSHEPGRVGERFVEALDLLEQAGYSQVSYFLKRERCEVSIDDARSQLQAGADAG